MESKLLNVKYAPWRYSFHITVEQRRRFQQLPSSVVPPWYMYSLNSFVVFPCDNVIVTQFYPPFNRSTESVSFFGNVLANEGIHYISEVCLIGWDLGLYSLSDKTSCRQITWSLEAARLGVIMVVSLWNLTGTSAAALSLSNFRAIGKV